MRCSSISLASLRASSTGWTCVRKARPKTPSKRPSILCSMVRSTLMPAGRFPGRESNAPRREAEPADRERRGARRPRRPAGAAAVGSAQEQDREQARAERGEPPRAVGAAAVGSAAAAAARPSDGDDQRPAVSTSVCQSAWTIAPGLSVAAESEVADVVGRRAAAARPRRPATRPRPARARPAWSARRQVPGRAARRAGRGRAAPSGASSGPATNSSPPRASRQHATSQQQRDGGRRRARRRARRSRAGGRARRARTRARGAARRAARAPAASAEPDARGPAGRRAAARRRRPRAAPRARAGERARAEARGTAARSFVCARRPPRVVRCAATSVARSSAASFAAPAASPGRGASARRDRVARAGRAGRAAPGRAAALRPGSRRPSGASGTPQNGWPAGERLPEQHADRPDVARRRSPRRRRAAPARCRRACPGTSPTAVSVSASSNCARPKSSRRTEMPVVVGEQDVRRLHVAVDDPARVRVREPVEDLRGRLDGVAVAEPPGAQRLAERAAGDVLVRDVDVAAVAAEVVGAQAALVAEPRGRLRLALRARSRLALARDDLERDLEAGPLVAGEPDRARAAAAERPERPVAVEDELPVRQGECWRSTPLGILRRRPDGRPFRAGRIARLRRRPDGRRSP